MNAITRDPETMHGVPVFRGTRVPVQTLFDYLKGGDTLEEFLDGSHDVLGIIDWLFAVLPVSLPSQSHLSSNA